MLDVRVHSAVGDEAEQVHVFAALERSRQSRVLEEGAVLDCLVHAHEVLKEHSAGADREMADFAVPHLPWRKPDRAARGFELRVRKGSPQTVEVRSLRELDGVAGPGRCAAPTVEDDEGYELVLAAARQIAMKESSSSDAPPTSAPSTSGRPRSSSALSGLTDPP